MRPIVNANRLLSLPEELVARIVEDSDASAVMRIEQTCTALRMLVHASTRLQYLRMCFATGKSPLSRTRAPASALLACLGTSNDAWRTLDLTLTRSEILDAPARRLFLQGDTLYEIWLESALRGMGGPYTAVLHVVTRRLPHGETRERLVKVPAPGDLAWAPGTIWKSGMADAGLLFVRWMSVCRIVHSHGTDTLNTFIHTAELHFLTPNGAPHPAAHAPYREFEYESDESMGPGRSAHRFLPDVALHRGVLALGWKNAGRCEVKFLDWTTGGLSRASVQLPLTPFDTTGTMCFIARDVLLYERLEYIDVVVARPQDSEGSNAMDFRHVVSLALPTVIEDYTLSSVVFQPTTESGSCAGEGRDADADRDEEKYYHHEHAMGPGTLTLALSVTRDFSSDASPYSERTLFLTLDGAAILKYADASYLKTLPLSASSRTGDVDANIDAGMDEDTNGDGGVPIVPWSVWSRGAVHVLDAPAHRVVPDALGVFGERLLYATVSPSQPPPPPPPLYEPTVSTSSAGTPAGTPGPSLSRTFVLYGYGRGRLRAPDSHTNPAESESARTQCEWSENTDEPLPAHVPALLTDPSTSKATPLPFTRTISRPFSLHPHHPMAHSAPNRTTGAPHTTSSSSSELDFAGRSAADVTVQALVFNDRYAVLSESFEELASDTQMDGRASARSVLHRLSVYQVQAQA